MMGEFKRNHCLIYVRINKIKNYKKKKQMSKTIKLMGWALTGLGTLFTAVMANDKYATKTEKTGHTIFGLSSVVAGVSMVLTETAIEEEEQRQQLAKIEKNLNSQADKKEEA